MKQWWEFKAQNFDTILFFKARALGLWGGGCHGCVVARGVVHRARSLPRFRCASSSLTPHTRPPPSTHQNTQPQVGKFYEIFHMDADIAVKELDLIYMKVRAGVRMCILSCPVPVVVRTGSSIRPTDAPHGFPSIQTRQKLQPHSGGEGALRLPRNRLREIRGAAGGPGLPRGARGADRDARRHEGAQPHGGQGEQGVYVG